MGKVAGWAVGEGTTQTCDLKSLEIIGQMEVRFCTTQQKRSIRTKVIGSGSTYLWAPCLLPFQFQGDGAAPGHRLYPSDAFLIHVIQQLHLMPSSWLGCLTLSQ